MKPLVLLAATILGLPLAAHAQSSWSPSSDELVQLLKPRANGPTRGIRPSNMAPAAPEPVAPAQRASLPVHQVHASAPVVVAAAAPAAATPAADGAGAVNLTVQFETGSDRLAPAAMKTLDTLGKALSNPELASYKFRIEGHTDAVGSPAANKALSERRAMAVTQYVASHYGVDPSRMTPVGMGETQMLVQTAEGVSEPRNRRVQIVNIGS